MNRKAMLYLWSVIFCLVAVLSGCRPQPNADLPPDVLALRGMDVLEEGDGQLAREFFELALSKEPDHPGAHAGMAQLAEGELDFDAAVDHYETAVLQYVYGQDEELDYEISRAQTRLAELYASMGDLERGERLLQDLAEKTGNSYYEDSLMENQLVVSSPLTTDLSPLASGEWDHLEMLSLSTPGVTDFSPVAALPNLKVLTLGDCGLEELSFLTSLDQLQVLQLMWNKLTDLRPLGELEHLELLDLSHNEGLSDLTGLEGLDRLKTLNVSDTRVEDLTPLQSCPSLERLDLSFLDVTDFSPLQNCPLSEIDVTGFSDAQLEAVSATLPDVLLTYREGLFIH